MSSPQAVAEAWGEWVCSMGEWHLFGALTYDPRRYVMSSRSTPARGPHPEAVGKHVRAWLRESSKRLNRPIEAVVVAIEAHKSGWPHAHPLLRLAGGLQPHDVITIGEVWFERRGYVKLEAPRNVQDVAEYAAKYLSKDVLQGDILLWPPAGGLDRHQPALSSRGRPGA